MQVDEKAEFYTKAGKGDISEKDARLLSEAADYWEDKCILEKTKKVFSSKYPG